MHLGAEVAAERLKAALAEQARMSDACSAAEGTAGEPVSRVRLQASNLQVAVCARMVNGRQGPQRAEAGS